MQHQQLPRNLVHAVPQLVHSSAKLVQGFLHLEASYQRQAISSKLSAASYQRQAVDNSGPGRASFAPFVVLIAYQPKAWRLPCLWLLCHQWLHSTLVQCHPVPLCTPLRQTNSSISPRYILALLSRCRVLQTASGNSLRGCLAGQRLLQGSPAPGTLTTCPPTSATPRITVASAVSSCLHHSFMHLRSLHLSPGC